MKIFYYFNCSFNRLPRFSNTFIQKYIQRFAGGCGCGGFVLGIFFDWWMSSSVFCNYGEELNIHSPAPPRQTWIMSTLIQAYTCIVCGVMGSWSTWGASLSCCNGNNNRYSSYIRSRKDLCLLWKIRIDAAPVQTINDTCKFCPW